MSELQIFKNAEFGSVRTVTVEGEPYFIAKDITEIIGYTDASKAIADHVDAEDKLNNESLSGLGQRRGGLINESALYVMNEVLANPDILINALLVYICSPYAGDIENNTAKAKKYSRFAVESRAIPFAPHLLMP